MASFGFDFAFSMIWSSFADILLPPLSAGNVSLDQQLPGELQKRIHQVAVHPDGRFRRFVLLIFEESQACHFNGCPIGGNRRIGGRLGLWFPFPCPNWSIGRRCFLRYPSRSRRSICRRIFARACQRRRWGDRISSSPFFTPQTRPSASPQVYYFDDTVGFFDRS